MTNEERLNELSKIGNVSDLPKILFFCAASTKEVQYLLNEILDYPYRLDKIDTGNLIAGAQQSVYFTLTFRRLGDA